MNGRLWSEFSESVLQKAIVDAATLCGLRVYHTHDSRRSEPGFPDLVIVGASGIIFRELKTAKGKLRTEQQYWLAILHGAGQDVAVWRPVDWPTRIMGELKALGKLTIVAPARPPRKPRIPNQGG